MTDMSGRLSAMRIRTITGQDNMAGGLDSRAGSSEQVVFFQAPRFALQEVDEAVYLPLY